MDATELRGRACPAWSPQEDQVLRTRWTVGGYEAVRDLLRHVIDNPGDYDTPLVYEAISNE